jgi:type IV pilus assembly protein PilB
MHTNSALLAMTRLIEIGVEPSLIAPAIAGVIAQRLVRRLCDCKERFALAPAEIERHFAWDGKTDVFFFRAKGCDRCGQTGYAGRLGIHEVFLVDETTRELISQRAPIAEIRKNAQASGFLPMRYGGLKKVLRGLTSLEEIDRVTLAED